MVAGLKPTDLDQADLLPQDFALENAGLRAQAVELTEQVLNQHKEAVERAYSYQKTMMEQHRLSLEAETGDQWSIEVFKSPLAYVYDHEIPVATDMVSFCQYNPDKDLLEFHNGVAVSTSLQINCEDQEHPKIIWRTRMLYREDEVAHHVEEDKVIELHFAE